MHKVVLSYLFYFFSFVMEKDEKTSFNADKIYFDQRKHAEQLFAGQNTQHTC